VIPSFFIFSKLIELAGSGDLRPEMDKARRYLASSWDRPVSWRWQFRRQQPRPCWNSVSRWCST